ncbi:MAG: HAMP domain-containing histidine kinase [Flavobacteriales bacterium]|nr:HAMP domain-containing histidine kinase [Flavobacteriales bacterium]
MEKAKKKLAASLEKEKELGELKSRFVATASHQFRTPLTVIQSSMGLLSMQIDSMDSFNEMDIDLKQKFEKVYHRVKGQIERMTSLMNDVLILGKINAGSIQPVLIPTNLILICKEIARTYNETQKDGRKVKIKIHGKSRQIKLDTKLMDHAISNLVSNAFKYSLNRPAPEITISFYDKKVDVLVKDSGMGIPEKDIRLLFEPFYRASNVSEISGTGLGTTIAKEYIELNNGSISGKRQFGKGTEFIIKFNQ